MIHNTTHTTKQERNRRITRRSGATLTSVSSHAHNEVHRFRHLATLLFVALTTLTLFLSCPDSPDSPDDITPPEAVNGFVAAKGDEQITLSWTNPTESDFDHVEITWTPPHNGGAKTLTAAESGNAGENGSTTISGLNGDTSYAFTIIAVDTNGNKSETQTITAIPVAPDTTPPAAVINLTVIAGNGQITILWTNPIQNDFDHIEITWTPPHNGGAKTLTAAESGNAGENGSTTISGLSGDTSYTFTVIAVDTSGNMSEAQTVTAIPVAPDTTPSAVVANLTAVVGNEQITLSWTNPTESDFDHIEVTWTPPHNGGTKTLTTTESGDAGGNGNTIITGLTNDDSYTFTVIAVDTNGNMAEAQTVTATPVVPDTTPPAAVTNLIAVAGNEQIVLSWTNPTESDFDHIEVTWTPPHNGGTKTLTTMESGNAGGNGNTTISGLNSGTSYTFTVIAVDLVGNQSNATTVSAALTAIQTASLLEDTSVAISLPTAEIGGTNITYHIISQPSNGALSGVAPNLTYTPNPDYFGIDQFTYRYMNDEGLQSPNHLVEITVQNVYDAPTVTLDDITVSEEQSVSIAPTITNPDTMPLIYIWSQVSGASTIVIDSPNAKTLSFTAPIVDPTGDVSADATLQVVVTDSSGANVSATALVTVLNITEPQLIVDNFSVAYPVNNLNGVRLSMVDGTEFVGDTHGTRITETFLETVSSNTPISLAQISGYGTHRLNGVNIVGINANGVIYHTQQHDGGIFWTSTGSSPSYSLGKTGWFVANGRPFTYEAHEFARWLTDTNTLFIASLENTSNNGNTNPLWVDGVWTGTGSPDYSRDGVYCDDPITDETYIPLCGEINDYVAHSGVGIENTIFVGAIKKAFKVGFSSDTARAAISGDGVFAANTIYVVSKDGSTSHATPVLAAYAAKLLHQNPTFTAAELRTALFDLAEEETLPHNTGSVTSNGNGITEMRTLQVIRDF